MRLELPTAELISTPFSLVLSGLRPGVEISLHTQTHDGSGECWQAR